MQVKSEQKNTNCGVVVLSAIKYAWKKTMRDYKEFRLNSERCLQSSLYHHLRLRLPNEFRIYIEPVVKFADGQGNECKTRKIAIDTLICKDKSIVAAIEIKFAPLRKPGNLAIGKDLLSLSRVTNRKARSDRVSIELPRHRNSGIKTPKLEIAKDVLLIFAAYCTDESTDFTAQTFWKAYKPEAGSWAMKRQLPQRLAVMLAKTKDNSEVKEHFFGKPFG